EQLRELRQQERQQGREEGALNAILLLLEMAVGPQPESVKEQVQALVEREGFKVIAARIFSAKTLADVLEGD
ncbi:MAG TPA: hypothetical protein PK299_08115, partial [Anaerolineales bacterium]|nr:hypothetical protein [Anaerolineales bacterium]